ncbi:MAG TPA: carboxymuconolactone decarboxylase family protein, partial [Chiayiivirga sp.]|nr:carboxymuconolactone decarboxylase family protein [Chiayiivirga sp.]
MTSTTSANRTAVVLGLALGLAATLAHASPNPQEARDMSRVERVESASETLSARQQAIVPIAALAAAGDIDRLGAAIEQGLDAGLAVSDIREVLVQLYAYAGFPRSLNAINHLMAVLDARAQRGIEDAPGRDPSQPIPTGDALLAAGTANQTRLVGGPVAGPTFDFAPAIDEYLKVHLFGAIFARDNLDWPSRELATVGMLSALPGAGAQLQSHMGMSMNTGITAGQLRHLVDVLSGRVDAESAQRAREALERHLDATAATSGQQLTQEWDKVFARSDQVDHRKVTFSNRYGITLAGDLYLPKNRGAEPLPAIVVAGPFGAVKEQSSGLYAQTMAERGFVALAFDPSYTGESGGAPRNVASPDINTEDFSAAVDFIGLQDLVDRERIGIIGICGWGGLSLNAVAVDKRVKAVTAVTMYDMSRVMSLGYNDSVTAEQRAQALEQLGQQRWADAENGAPAYGPISNELKGGEAQFLVDYADYYRTPRGFHPRAINSNGSWTLTNPLSFMNMPILT